MKALSKRNKKILAGGVLVLLAAALALLLTFCNPFTSGPTALVKRYVAALNERNFDDFCGCFPPFMQQQVKNLAANAGGEEAFFEQNYAAVFREGAPYDSFGDSVTVSVSGATAERHELTDGAYNGVDVAGMGGSAVATVTCTMTTKGSLRSLSEQANVLCIKIGSRWYLLAMTANNSADTATPTDVQ